MSFFFNFKCKNTREIQLELNAQNKYQSTISSTEITTPESTNSLPTCPTVYWPILANLLIDILGRVHLTTILAPILFLKEFFSRIVNSARMLGWDHICGWFCELAGRLGVWATGGAGAAADGAGAAGSGGTSAGTGRLVSASVNPECLWLWLFQWWVKFLSRSGLLLELFSQVPLIFFLVVKRAIGALFLHIRWALTYYYWGTLKDRGIRFNHVTLARLHFWLALREFGTFRGKVWVPGPNKLITDEPIAVHLDFQGNAAGMFWAFGRNQIHFITQIACCRWSRCAFVCNFVHYVCKKPGIYLLMGSSFSQLVSTFASRLNSEVISVPGARFIVEYSYSVSQCWAIFCISFVIGLEIATNLTEYGALTVRLWFYILYKVRYGF